jgi:MoaA/NifB/PqqE/SkfB family radical SAM enzyme
MNKHSPHRLEIWKSILSHPQMILAKPAVNLFLLQYLKKFKIQKVNGQLIVHSHLPPLNSKAYLHFINQHLLSREPRLSHAQIGLTNACPQNCEYCYNKNRIGKVMDTEQIIKLIQDLKRLGVFWLGFTGGEPLLNKDIVKITESVGEDCSLKLFTTGCTLTSQLARDLQQAGLLYVSISLDHWREEVHDGVRRYKGAFQAALTAIDIFKNLGNVHVGVSAVLSKKMLQNQEAEQFLEFLIRLGVHEAWLSETKPSVDRFWNSKSVISEQERIALVTLQDRYNQEGKITVNYLGHFEGKEHFGCNAGHKMIYIDAFGEVSPCVFTPMTMGNIQQESIQEIYTRMQSYFPSEESCFINKNYPLLQKYSHDGQPLCFSDSLAMLQEVQFGPYSKFFQLYYGKTRS